MNNAVIVFAASGSLTTSAGSGNALMYNVTINIGQTVTLQNRWGFGGTMTINGTWAGSSNVDVRGSQTTPFVFGGSGSYAATGILSWLIESTITVSIPAHTDWPEWRMQPLAANRSLISFELCF